MKKIIITGANGLIGSYLVKLLTEKYQIHSLVRNKPPKSVENVIYHNIDLGQQVNYSKLPDKADAIVYLAQSDNFRNFPEKSAEIFQVNTSQVLHMLDYARQAGVRTFIYASSGGVYGSYGGERGFSEETCFCDWKFRFLSSTKLAQKFLLKTLRLL